MISVTPVLSSGAWATMAIKFFEPMTPPKPPRPQKRGLLSPLLSWFSELSAMAAMRLPRKFSPEGPMTAKWAPSYWPWRSMIFSWASLPRRPEASTSSRVGGPPTASLLMMRVTGPALRPVKMISSMPAKAVLEPNLPEPADHMAEGEPARVPFKGL